MERGVFLALVASIASVAGAACEPGTRRISLVVGPGVRSALIGVTAEGSSCDQLVAAYGVPVVDGRAELITARAAGDHRVLRAIALLYREDLAKIGFSAGTLPIGGGPSCRLPAFDSAEEIDLARSEWSARADAGPLTGCLCPHGPTDCASFRAERLPLSAAGNGTDALAIDARTALAGIGDAHQLLRIIVTATAVRIAELPHPFAMPIFGLARIDAGTIWSAGGNTLWRMPLDAPLEAVLTSSAPELHNLRWLSSGTSSGADDLFGLSFEGAFGRFDRGAWHTLYSFPDTGLSRYAGGTLRVGPGEAFAVKATSSLIAHVRGAGVSEETAAGGGEAFSAIGAVPGLGTVVASTLGNFFRNTDTGWELIGSSSLAIEIRVVVPYLDGFFFAGVSGAVGEYRPGFGFCATVALAPQTINSVAVLGRDVLLVGDRSPDSVATLTLLRRTN